jgi:hypothetical protein
MTDNPRDTSVLIRADAVRISRGLPRAILVLGAIFSLVQAVNGREHLGGALIPIAVCVPMAGIWILLRQLSALTEVSSVGIHKAGLGLDLGFRSWQECATIHTLWFRPYWYLGKNLLWSVQTQAYVPDPGLLDDNNVRLFYEAVRQFAPANHPLLAKLRANPRVRKIVRNDG